MLVRELIITLLNNTDILDDEVCVWDFTSGNSYEIGQIDFDRAGKIDLCIQGEWYELL